MRTAEQAAARGWEWEWEWEWDAHRLKGFLVNYFYPFPQLYRLQAILIKKMRYCVKYLSLLLLLSRTSSLYLYNS